MICSQHFLYNYLKGMSPKGRKLVEDFFFNVPANDVAGGIVLVLKKLADGEISQAEVGEFKEFLRAVEREHQANVENAH